MCSALAGVAQGIECWPGSRKVTNSILSPGHMPGLQARSPVGDVREATDPCISCMSMFLYSLSPSLPLCLKLNK